MNVEQIVENAFYLLAILNPASKVMFLATYDPRLTDKQNFELSWKSSLAALAILILLAAVGEFVLTQIFRVELYSLQIVGGLLLFSLGMTAIREGRFIHKREQDMRNSFTDISLVPLAAPLIAGPGMIAAAITGCALEGIMAVSIELSLAILINFGLMLFSRSINMLLTKLHILGPLIRLTGLVIAVVATQMAVSGIRAAFNLAE